MDTNYDAAGKRINKCFDIKLLKFTAPGSRKKEIASKIAHTQEFLLVPASRQAKDGMGKDARD